MWLFFFVALNRIVYEGLYWSYSGLRLEKLKFLSFFFLFFFCLCHLVHGTCVIKFKKGSWEKGHFQCFISITQVKHLYTYWLCNSLILKIRITRPPYAPPTLYCLSTPLSLLSFLPVFYSMKFSVLSSWSLPLCITFPKLFRRRAERGRGLETAVQVKVMVA